MTELIWESKYRDGKRVAPVRIALPFQTVETVNESMRDRQRMLELFATGRSAEWRNRLIWGDKKYVLPSLLPEFAGCVDLVYCAFRPSRSLVSRHRDHLFRRIAIGAKRRSGFS